MNEIRQGWIEGLAEKATRLRMEWEALSLRNIYGLSVEERIKSAKEYAVAEAEMYEAEAKLRAAVSAPL